MGGPLASLSAVWLPFELYLVAALDERIGWPPHVGARAGRRRGGSLLLGAGLST